uniref:RAD50 interactor 1 n=1 Tax=Eptatretus burgeri TaxID=7764 RepID=A0A8C4R3V6_EPTBU
MAAVEATGNGNETAATTGTTTGTRGVRRSNEGFAPIPAHVAGLVEREFAGNAVSLRRRLPEVLARLSAEKAQLEAQVVTASSEVPRLVQRALLGTEDVARATQELQERRSRLSDDVHDLVEELQPWLQLLEGPVAEVEGLEKYLCYLKWISWVEELSDSIQQHLMTSSITEALSKLVSLSELDQLLKPSSCSHLVAFVRSTLLFWHNILCVKLTSDFEEVLKQLKWPFVGPMQLQSLPAGPSAGTGALRASLAVLFRHLLQLQIPEEVVSKQSTLPDSFWLPSLPPIALPFQLMLRPLQKRFKYHFYGNKQTNAIDKPEWYMTQVLTWIGNHSTFLETVIQPILTKEDILLDAKVEFSRGLVMLMLEKLASDMPSALYDDQLFCHVVDEALQFDRDLAARGYPAHYPRTLHVLAEDACRQKWLSVERKFALEKIDSMLSSSMAWTCHCQDIADIDDAKVPDCAETFMTLLQVITERYRSLPHQTQRLQFLRLQLDLLDDFRLRLTQVMKEEISDPVGMKYCSILNAVCYILTVLADWSDDVFFLELQQAMLAEVSEGEQGLSQFQIGRLASLEASVFDTISQLLDHLRLDMLGKLGDWVFSEARDKAAAYRKERWLSLPAPRDQLAPSLSPSACPLLLLLRDRMLQLQRQQAPAPFRIFWQTLATRLDTFLYEEVRNNEEYV